MEQVTELIRIRQLAELKKSVIIPTCGNPAKPMPAGVVLNMSGATILGYIMRGMFVYESKKKTDTRSGMIQKKVKKGKTDERLR